MTPHTTGIDDIITRADPLPDPLDDHLVGLAAALAETTREASAPRRRRGVRRRWLWIPVACVAALTAASGAAAATGLLESWHVTFTVQGHTVDKDVTADVSIPLHFVTKDGQQRSCTYSLAYVWGDAGPLRAFLKAHDWTGFGQQAYDEYLAHPYYPTEGSLIGEDGVEHKLTPDELKANGPDFTHSIGVVYTRTLPPELRNAQVLMTGTTDCEGVQQ